MNIKKCIKKKIISNKLLNVKEPLSCVTFTNNARWEPDWEKIL